MKFSGVMVDLVRLDIQFTPENSFLDVLKALGTLKSLPLQPAELIPLLLPNQVFLHAFSSCFMSVKSYLCICNFRKLVELLDKLIL